VGGFGGYVGGLAEPPSEFTGRVSGVGDVAQDWDAPVPNHALLTRAAGVPPGVGGEFVYDGSKVAGEFLIGHVAPQASS
jgi:hypothetical protein